MRHRGGVALLLCGLFCAAGQRAEAAGLILNEYNAVGPNDLLGNSRADTFFGRIEGNGRDWLELVVVDDHLDIRGWELRWYQEDVDATGDVIWDPTRTTPGVSGQGRIIFSGDDDWSDLRRGTILTITEQERLTDVFEVVSQTTKSYDLRTDLSFDPENGDWHMQVSTEDEAENTTPLLFTESNITGDVEGNFPVGNDNWELTIVDDDGEVVFGPIGEDINGWGGGGLGDTEVGKLEFPAAPATLASWEALDVSNFRDGSSSTFGSANLFGSGTTTQDFSPLRNIDVSVEGDTNGDGKVTIEDLNNVRNNFGGTGLGDTNNDGQVTIEDLNNVRNNFGAGTGGANAVPEPGTMLMAAIGLAALFFRRR
jgi:hypothetical protein